MSRVFLARDETLGRDVVVKVLAPELAEGLSAERFVREIKLAASLQEPHIVAVHAAGTTPRGLPYYTMPFVDGESLRGRMATGVPASAAVSILRDVAKALAYAHARGVVHRDIKPENVLLSNGTAVVTDFGIAKAVSASKTQAPGGALTAVGISLGTPAYMAPEQAAGDDVDQRADIYAWGVLAYELLRGAHPFAGKATAQQYIAAHMAERPAPLGAIPDVSPALSALVMRCLEKDPSRRPSSAEELLAALDDASRGRSPKRPSLRLAVGAAVALLMAIIIAAGVWRARAQPKADARLVVVLPFRVSGADPSLRYLREGMVDLLAAKLTGATRVVEPRTALAAWRRSGGGETSDVDESAAESIASRLGASEVLLGEITGDGGNVVLRASLLPAAGGPSRDASVEGPADSISTLVDRLAGQLLAIRQGEDARMLGGLTGTPLPAIRAYLDGQAIGREGQYREALASYRSAVQIDSNFAAGWVGMLEMAEWAARGATRDTAAAALTRLLDKLPAGVRAAIVARIGPHYPAQASIAETHRLAEAATQVAPDNADAWYWLGEVFYHFGAAEGIADAPARAITAFEHALALDSSDTRPLEHLPELYYLRRDTAMAQRAIEARLARDTTEGVARLDYFFDDEVLGHHEQRSKWASPTGAMGSVALLATQLGLPMADVDSALSSAMRQSLTDVRRAGAARTLFSVALVRGQPARAMRILRETQQPPGRQLFAPSMILRQYVLGDVDSASAADARRHLAKTPADTAGGHAVATFSIGLYDLQRGDRESAQRAVRALRAIPPARCDRTLPNQCADYALVLDAQLAAVEHRADAPQRLAELDSVMRTGPAWEGPLLESGNLIAARLWEAAGDNARALAAIRRRGHFLGEIPSIATYFREEGRLAAATGDRAEAIDAYTEYLTLRQDAEPGMRQDLAGIQREVARLKREQAGR